MMFQQDCVTCLTARDTMHLFRRSLAGNVMKFQRIEVLFVGTSEINCLQVQASYNFSHDRLINS